MEEQSGSGGEVLAIKSLPLRPHRSATGPRDPLISPNAPQLAPYRSPLFAEHSGNPQPQRGQRPRLGDGVEDKWLYRSILAQLY